jgi:hypothetical protein
VNVRHENEMTLISMIIRATPKFFVDFQNPVGCGVDGIGRKLSRNI